MEKKDIPKGCVFGIRGCAFSIVLYLLFVLISSSLSSVDFSCSEKNDYYISDSSQNQSAEIEIDSAFVKNYEDEKRRKEIFAVDARAYYEVVQIVMEKYPNNIKKQTELEDKMVEQYQKKIMKKYGITKSELEFIILEGNEKRWKWK